MAANTLDEHHVENAQHFKSLFSSTGYRLGGGAVLVLIGIWIGTKLTNLGGTFDDSFIQSVITEAVSIFIIVAILDTLAEERAERAYKKLLVRQAGSTSNEIAKAAVVEIRKRRWLGEIDKKSLLKGANLQNANLTDANLQNANLENADLRDANLAGADLQNANLEGANLFYTHLENADLRGANLKEADLRGAYLENAGLIYARLGGADLRGAHLTGANLFGVICKKHTILPNGRLWTPETDWTQFGAILKKLQLNHKQLGEPLEKSKSDWTQVDMITSLPKEWLQHQPKRDEGE